MEEKLVELLHSIGLTKNEIEVYLNLLKSLPSTAYVIARKMGLYRSSVYEALRKLQQKGLIVEIQEKGRKLYQTKEYTAIEKYLAQKQTELKEITPYLKEISNTQMPESGTSISYGPTRLRTLFSSLLDLKREIFIWTIPKNINEILGDWFLKEINEKTLNQKISVKIIYSKNFDSIKGTDKNQFIETRYRDEETNIFTMVCSDLVSLIVLANPITIIEMRNSDIAEGFKSRFFISWEEAKK